MAPSGSSNGGGLIGSLPPSHHKGCCRGCRTRDPLFSVLTGGWTRSQGFFSLAFQRSREALFVVRSMYSYAVWPGLLWSGPFGLIDDGDIALHEGPDSSDRATISKKLTTPSPYCILIEGSTLPRRSIIDVDPVQAVGQSQAQTRALVPSPYWV